VVAAVKRDLPGGGFAWTKTRGGSIAQLMAATLAHWALLTFSPAARPKPVSPPPMSSESSSNRHQVELIDLDKVPF
jgi:hypothetical protein